MSGVPRSTAILALEALELGDVNHAAALLRSALKDEPHARPFACGRCRRSFRFPGELDDHLQTSRCGLVEQRSRSAA